MDEIVVRGAREHNLKNLSLSIPRNRLVVITGVSGSGKSSLAFDTLFAEGQRRYVESLSAYARQFLPQVEKPDFDSIDGLSPAISIEQKSVSRNPRSTVGTVTEIHDYLRLLYASIGVPHCPSCGQEIRPQTVQQMVDRLLSLPEGTRLWLYAPYVRGKKGEYRKQLAEMGRQGFVRARIDGAIVDLSQEIPALDKQKKHSIDVLVDRLVVRPGLEKRLADSLETALRVGSGLVLAAPEGLAEEMLSQSFACSSCGTSLSEITPRLFSFNSPWGACGTCSGLGTLMAVDRDKVVLDPERSIDHGALALFQPGSKSWRLQMLRTLARAMKFSLATAWKKLPVRARTAILEGHGDQELTFEMAGKKSRYSWEGKWEGILPMLERRYRETDSALVRGEIEKYMSIQVCPDCRGRRLKPEALSITVGGSSIDRLSALPVAELRGVIAGLDLSERERTIAGKVVQEISDRLRFLDDVGVGYLALDRSSATLSGGESQRIRLATQIGSKLMGVLYVLDEPSIGLHQRDNERLLATLRGMRDLGNSVLVVEHDEDTIRAADWVIDLGPGAGIHGGEIVAQGTPAEVAAHPDSLTGRYLRGEVSVATPARRAKGSGKRLTVEGARHHNLRDLSVDFPLGTFTVVTGVSGSGKSSLVNDILHRALARHFYRAGDRPGEHDRLSGLEHLDKVIAIDQSPIGRTPRSNPATYTNVFNPIRNLLAMTPEARARGYQAGRFSFNVKGGRCEACGGDGQIKIEMHFLPDIYVTCEVCGGKRYDRETLAVRYKGLNVAEILDLTVEQARDFFGKVPAVERVLATLDEVGLGYLHLGQPATTLSGGEAQRVKLAAELCKRSTGRTLYLLDEPTTGLHFDDVRKLLELLHKLVGKGNTVIVVEHNLDVIRTADWVIDLGPDGGAAGGRLVATGTPEEVARVAGSRTGEFLARALAGPAIQARPAGRRRR
ncbi:MAG: excinuclease ABC subunit UvrA [Thermoanaerobaculia bacterium]|nr:MAG: excinuclease ABC subunit UvrA [Thermoanaerobaculia bacterium]MBZ0103977.1 excinuclease ABC subunit UvrA [Thermoanaerobaculia bacterium]